MDAEVDFRAVMQTIWKRKYLVLSIVGIFSALGVIIALILPNVYAANALLAPNQTQTRSGLTGLLAENSALASFAGMDLPSAEVGKVDIALEILQSRRFIIEFIDRHNILVPLMAAQGWDPLSNTLEINNDVYDSGSGTWTREVSPPQTPVPSDLEAYEAFREIFSVMEADTVGFYRIQVEHYSPHVAKEWVDWLVEDINSTVKLGEIEQAERAISYLNGQLTKTAIGELRSVLFGLIEEQMKVIALANATPEYVFRAVDPALVPEIPSRPNRVVLILIAVFFGLGIGFVTAVTLGYRESAIETNR
ncbi:Wzz/FepE/Etk N-terminal domain-containing protein [Lentisalinibacter sediminis]|uniref:Wzz/FepE/Etk N-terminal domain-containing protein n=1 Tax=Lentisalinibacter sediminis TaxID=2992237 RepID=UPI0038696B9A